MTTSAPPTAARAGFIFITLVIEAMGFGIIMPVLPDVIRKFVSGEADVASMFGYFAAVYALLQFLFAPVLGRLSDKYGRRPVLLLSLFGAGVDYAFMAFAPTLGLLFIGRLISGVSGASYTVVTAYIADISDDTNRAKNFGLIGAGFGLGFIMGPALGGLVAGHGLVYPFLLAAGLNILNFLFGLIVLPESLPKHLRRNFALKDLNPFHALKVLTSMPTISLLVVAHVFIQLAGQTHPSMWAIYTESRFGWTTAEVGISLTVVGLLTALAQGVFTGPLVKYFGEKRLGLWGSLGESLGYMGYGLASTGLGVYAVLAVSSIFWASHPAIQSLIARGIPADRQGELQGALMSLTSLTAVVNPIVMTHIFARTSVLGGPVYLPGAVYFISGGLGLIAFAAIWKWESSSYGSPAES